MVRAEKPDLVLLDVVMPDMDGFEVCRILRDSESNNLMPIIMLTSQDNQDDKLIGLELGADDYITKPFSPRELLARIKAVLRRINTSPEREILEAGSIELDLGKHELRVKEKPVEITAKEFALLEAMMASKGRVLTRETLLGKVWGYENSTRLETRTVDMHITQLRKKLKNEAPRIVTLKGVGYRFDGD